MRVLIAGCGYVGTALGAELVKAGHEAWGMRRDAAAARQLEKVGIKPMVANLLRAEDLKNLPAVDVLVFCQAPSRKSDEYRTTYYDGTKNLLSVLANGGVTRGVAPTSIRKIILISSTSVYAAKDGSWVDETTDPMTGSHADAESRENARVMLAQEELVLQSGRPAIVFRLAGIYGPGRNRVRPIFEGRLKPSLTDIYMNRIHLQDIVRGIRLLLEKGSPGEIYLGSDDAPCTQREFYSWVFEKLSLPLPGSSLEPETIALGSSKRCSNKKIKALGLKFRYPTYRDGYQPLIDEVLADTARKGEPGRRSEWLS